MLCFCASFGAGRQGCPKKISDHFFDMLDKTFQTAYKFFSERTGETLTASKCLPL